jgi:hypothetical protein
MMIYVEYLAEQDSLFMLLTERNDSPLTVKADYTLTESSDSQLTEIDHFPSTNKNDSSSTDKVDNLRQMLIIS